MTTAVSDARVLYQRFPAGGAFTCIDDGFLAGYGQLGCAVRAWTDIEGEPTLREVVDEFHPTHIVACLHNPDRSLCRWTGEASIESLRATQSHLSVRMNPPDIEAFFQNRGIDFTRFPEFGVSSYYNRSCGLTQDERRVLTSGVVDLVRTPIAAGAIEICFRSVLELGVSVLEELHAADTRRYPVVEPSPDPRYAATFVGRCWPFKWMQMEPYIDAMRDRLGDRFAVFGSGWPKGISLGPIDDAGFANLVATSAASLNLHEPTQVLDRPFGQNERVFKLMSMGACVVSDANPALATQFKIGEELLLAQTPDEMVARVELVEADPARRREIATAGRARVLAEHTYEHRAQRLLALSVDPPGTGSVVTHLGAVQMCDQSAILDDIVTSDDTDTDQPADAASSQTPGGVVHS